MNGARGSARGLALQSALAVILVSTWASVPAGAQTSASLHVVGVDPDPAGPAVRTAFFHARFDEGGGWGEWEWAAEGAVWLDGGQLDASVLAPVELSLGRRWDWGSVKAGVGPVLWGVSDRRSPAAMSAPVGLLWSSVSAPAIGNPFVEFATRVGGADVEAVLLPLRPPTQSGRLADVTWDGRRLDAPEAWETEAGYGIRIWRSFDAFDLGVWWMDAQDRRPWIDPAPRQSPGEGSEARVRHPRTRQLGGTVEWVLGPTVVRGEGGLARRDDAWHSRGLLGVEWFITPYLTLLLEQGLASDRNESASPLVDDSLLGVQLVTETTRFQGGFAVDPGSGTRHLWSTVRWTATDRVSVELEWTEAWGDILDESSSALRQPRALRLGGVWYF